MGIPTEKLQNTDRKFKAFLKKNGNHQTYRGNSGKS